MPLARGIMQFGRINVYPTTSIMTSIVPSDGAHCGDTVQFNVQVSNDRGIGFPGPTGNVQILDKVTGNLIATGVLLPSGPNSTSHINVVLQTGNIIPIVNYNGVVNQFGNSQSTNSSIYIVGPIATTTTITTANGSYFCFHQPFTVNAHVVQNSGVLTPTGNVRFILYSDNINYDIIGIDNLNGSGNASIVIPANFTTPGNDYHLQAIYEGSGCFSFSNSAAGLSGTLLHSVLGDNTTVTCAVSGINPFCIHLGKTFTAFVNATNLPDPSIGSVTWTAFKSPTTVILGTDNTVVNGNASITVAPNFFPSQGVWQLHANYTGDGYCYDNSVSSDLAITPTEWATTINVISSPTSFCIATVQSFFAFISSSTPGTISGTFNLTSFNDSQLIDSQVSSGPHTGFYIGYVSLPAFTFTSGAQNVRCNFVTDLGGCYASDASPNYPINVHSSGDQHPTVTMTITPATGDTFTTWTFHIVVHKNSGVGPLDGALGLSGKASLYHYNGFSFVPLSTTIHIFDGATTGTGTFSQGGFSSGDNIFYAHWNGNSCYGPGDSVLVHKTVDNPPPH